MTLGHRSIFYGVTFVGLRSVDSFEFDLILIWVIGPIYIESGKYLEQTRGGSKTCQSECFAR
jgi:hypothetical protein